MVHIHFALKSSGQHNNLLTRLGIAKRTIRVETLSKNFCLERCPRQVIAMQMVMTSQGMAVTPPTMITLTLKTDRDASQASVTKEFTSIRIGHFTALIKHLFLMIWSNFSIQTIKLHMAGLTLTYHDKVSYLKHFLNSIVII